MRGEIDYANLLETFKYKVPILVYMFLVLFLFLVPVIMANLVIGLAVHDIRSLIQKAKTRQISMQLSYFHNFETFVEFLKSVPCFPQNVRDTLDSLARVDIVHIIHPNKPDLPRSRWYISRWWDPSFGKEVRDKSVNIVMKHLENQTKSFVSFDDEVKKLLKKYLDKQ